MTGFKMPAEGGCRCGAVRFEVTAPPLLTMACHCTGCQRMTASAFSLSAAIPAEGFALVAGEPVAGGLPGSGHAFCPACKSWMFTQVEGMDAFVNVRATLFDDTTWVSPFVETYTSEALAWAKTPAVHSYSAFPPMEDFPGLIEAYRRAAASR